MSFTTTSTLAPFHPHPPHLWCESVILDLVLKWIRLPLNGTHWAKMYWNLIWKSSGFVPFGANLAYFGAKPDIPSLSINVSTTIACLYIRWPIRLLKVDYSTSLHRFLNVQSSNIQLSFNSNSQLCRMSFIDVKPDHDFPITNLPYGVFSTTVNVSIVIHV